VFKLVKCALEMHTCALALALIESTPFCQDLHYYKKEHKKSPTCEILMFYEFSELSYDFNFFLPPKNRLILLSLWQKLTSMRRFLKGKKS
jgi:hypothetical protein